ncbi:solute carrier family 35 member E3-like [Venturia canescens]|uniref:solute carrier family 35 member E3-like n=1 Tax=Venturia canescens TaxID=32260 RepID=UPI001C9BF0B4|nr:solute carrier family 35 member E3-like [Venturia canescens]
MQHKKERTVFYLLLNVLFSIAIVLLNKWLYVHTGFPNVTLTMIHFIVTFIGLVICEKFDIFCIKDVAIGEMIVIAMTFCGFVVLTNLSLAHNTVGTYQVAKMLTTPCVIVIQILFYNKHFSNLVKLTLLPIVVGVFINFYYDLRFNLAGTLYATLGVLVTSLYQVWVNSKQKEFQMNPMQLLYYQAPLSAVMLIPIVPILEPIGDTFSHGWTLVDILMILLSSVVAFFVNLTSYWIIGHTSPLTYNMLGHTKFCLLLLGGSIVFQESLDLNQAIGISLTMIGILLYARVKMRDNRRAAVAALLDSRGTGANKGSYAI